MKNVGDPVSCKQGPNANIPNSEHFLANLIIRSPITFQKHLLKYVLKICRLNFEIVAVVTRPCIRDFSHSDSISKLSQSRS